MSLESPAGDQKPDPHVLVSAAEVADQEIHETFREVVHVVASSFPELRGQHPNLTVRDFKIIVKVALLELFAPDEFPTTAARAKRLDFRVSDIKMLSEDDAYKRIREALLVAFEDLARPRTYLDHLQDVKTQDRIFREQKRYAFHGADAREKARTIAAFADRWAPVIRTTNQTNVVVIQQSDLSELDSLEKRLELAGHPILNITPGDARPALHPGTPPADPNEG